MADTKISATTAVTTCPSGSYLSLVDPAQAAGSQNRRYTGAPNIVEAASALGTDNVLVRANGTGRGVQATGITADDSDNLAGIANITATGAATANSIGINGSTSGTVTLAVPATAGTNTATFPAATGTVHVGGEDITVGSITSGIDGFWTVDEHASAPGTPSSGKVAVYAKADGNIYQKDDAGTETSLAGGGSGGASNFGDILAAGAIHMAQPAQSGTGLDGFSFNDTTEGTPTYTAATSTTPICISYATGTSSGTDAGVKGNGDNIHLSRDFDLVMEGALVDLTDVRVGIGFATNALTTGADDPAEHVAFFRFSTNASDTNFQAITNDASGGGTITDTSVAGDTDFHVFRIVRETTSIYFYIDGTLVATHTTNLPAGSARAAFTLRNLAASDKSFKFVRFGWTD